MVKILFLTISSINLQLYSLRDSPFHEISLAQYLGQVLNLLGISVASSRLLIRLSKSFFSIFRLFVLHLMMTTLQIFQYLSTYRSFSTVVTSEISRSYSTFLSIDDVCLIPASEWMTTSSWQLWPSHH